VVVAVHKFADTSIKFTQVAEDVPVVVLKIQNRPERLGGGVVVT
jgi:hypothetical protein